MGRNAATEGQEPGCRVVKGRMSARGASARALEQLLGLALKLEPGVLLGLVSRETRDPLDKVEDALGRVALLNQDLVDDLTRLQLREAALAQEGLAVLVGPRHDLLAGRLDPVDEPRGRGIGKAGQRRCRLMREAGGRNSLSTHRLLKIAKVLEVGPQAILNMAASQADAGELSKFSTLQRLGERHRLLKAYFALPEEIRLVFLGLIENSRRHNNQES